MDTLSVLSGTVAALRGSTVKVGEADKGPRVPSDPKEVRYKIALLVIAAYIVMLFVPLGMVWTGRLSEPDGVDLLKTIAAVFGGPVGAVIGFYFSALTK
jgi:hypothetical protein